MWEIDYQYPLELNRYLYAAANPVLWRDPSGYGVTELALDFRVRIAGTAATLTAFGDQLGSYYTRAIVWLAQVTNSPEFNYVIDRLIDLGYKKAVDQALQDWVDAQPQTRADVQEAERVDDETPIIYVTYTKTNPVTGRVYAGRSSGIGDPFTIVKNRDMNHHKNAEGYAPAILDEFAEATLPYADRHSDPAYLAIRGREQQLIDSYGGAWSDVGMENTESGNEIRGVAKDKWYGRAAHEAANASFGQLAAYTGY